MRSHGKVYGRDYYYLPPFHDVEVLPLFLVVAQCRLALIYVGGLIVDCIGSEDQKQNNSNFNDS
jgi:hypothetical protein